MSDNVIPLRTHHCDPIGAVKSSISLPDSQPGVDIFVDKEWTCSCGRRWQVRTSPNGWYASHTTAVS